MTYATWWIGFFGLVLSGIVVVDVILGARAEYMNGAAVLEAWLRLLTEGTVRSRHAMFFGAATLPPGLRLGVGTMLWALEAALIASALAWPAWRLRLLWA